MKKMKVQILSEEKTDPRPQTPDPRPGARPHANTRKPLAPTRGRANLCYGYRLTTTIGSSEDGQTIFSCLD